MEAVVGEGELALVDQQADVDLAVDDGVLDLIERRDDGLEIRLEQPQRQVRAGQQPGDRDALAADVGSGHRRLARRAADRSGRPSRRRAEAARTESER